MKNQDKNLVKIMDTTLRDGEQMKNVSYTPEEKLSIARILLEEVQVDWIEIASARVSMGEEKAAAKVIEWAGENNRLDQVEILGLIDTKQSIDWIHGLGGRVVNLLAKGSLNHVEKQLGKSSEAHVSDIQKTLDYAVSKDFICNIYLEDWSNGMIHSREYIYFLIDALKETPICRFMLPDTLGIQSPAQVTESVSDLIERYPELQFDYHAHNDYGLAVANSLAAVDAGFRCVHTTVNGMGERAGNCALDELVIGIHDFLNLKTSVNEKMLYHASETVEIYSGCRIAFNKPISGPNVFTQTAGIHADGDKKGNLYASALLPERFNRKRQYSLGKLSGRSNLDYNLKKMGIDLNEAQKKEVLQRIVELGDRKTSITEEDLPYIVADVLDTPQEHNFRIDSCIVVTSFGMKPVATVKLLYKAPDQDVEEELEENANGDGGYDAFMNAIKYIAKKKKIRLPKLSDYMVSIPPGGKTDALVQCSITWEMNGKRFVTRGLNSDQLLAATEATEKMLNLIEI